ncbi:MAG: HAMP domain-containing sensor histidine kinase [Nitrospirota bacterium]
MLIYIKKIINKIKYTAMLLVMVLIWSLFFMIYLDYFITPFDRLIPWLLPIKGLYSISPDSSMTDRLSIMQGILDSSHKVSNTAFIVMILSFAIFSVYLTFIYQQRQRRSQENRLLLLKNQEIARRNEFIRYISATIGHEFKNNLARIKRRLDLLSGIPDESRERLDGNLEKLFADITIFKKISEEREEELAGFTKISLKQMLSEIADQHKDLADVTFRDQLSPPDIYASEDLLYTVFENLLDNAVKFKKPGQPRAKIIVSFSIDRDVKRPYVALSFRDEGIGMNEQQADESFYKGVDSKTGWGQGLYFAKYVIGLHAGKIRVGKEHTEPGTGTEIIINLPFVEEALNV